MATISPKQDQYFLIDNDADEGKNSTYRYFFRNYSISNGTGGRFCPTRPNVYPIHVQYPNNKPSLCRFLGIYRFYDNVAHAMGRNRRRSFNANLFIPNAFT